MPACDLPDGKTILFGGDLGRYGRPVLPDPAPVERLTCCSSNRPTAIALHPKTTTGRQLAAIINDTVARGGKLIMPAFAIGRVEEVIYWLKRLEERTRIPVLPVYVDSPMAAKALQFYGSVSTSSTPT